MTEMTLEEIATEQKRADDAFATDVLEIGCGWYRRLLALARRALELAEREAGIWGRVNALAEKVLEQPAPTGEVTRNAERYLRAARAAHSTHAMVPVDVLEALVQAGRQEAQGGWVPKDGAARRKLYVYSHAAEAYVEATAADTHAPELYGVAGYLRAELEQFGSARSYRVERALRLLESLLPPPPSDTGKSGGK